ncbi:hypothetical protein BpHYR1_032664 [Brachionus plicatilis]|uniref:Secreted protein n=1 Tax=Brachionus plicatilis TaxID=10195 RepID=A0A3M7RAS4_BRAPC|nr:hypothetical protein BpHYR1_032664 [Brachionus plicatilis]
MCRRRWAEIWTLGLWSLFSWGQSCARSPSAASCCPRPRWTPRCLMRTALVDLVGKELEREKWLVCGMWLPVIRQRILFLDMHSSASRHRSFIWLSCLVYVAVWTSWEISSEIDRCGKK